VVVAALCSTVVSAEPVELSEKALIKSARQHGVIVFEVNWGRQWGCAGLDNAQLQALTFSRLPDGPTLDLKTPSRLFVDDSYKGYALLVEPGEYVLTGFDVKVAKSVRDVGHLVAEGQDYGRFSVAGGEFVYIGHFSLDCSEEAIPWRYYMQSTEDFAQFVRGFKRHYPFVGEVDVEYRLFDTDVFGFPYSLSDEASLSGQE
jgi:hypothetical protein